MFDHSFSEPNAGARSRVIFFGMHGRFSSTTLLALLEAGVNVCAVVVWAEQGPPVMPLEAPTLQRREGSLTTVGLAWQHDIPAFAVRRVRSPEVHTLLSNMRPDVACVAGFAQRIPSTLLRLPTHGFINAHPSLLPAYRGPSPLFWVLQNDRRYAGVTIHLMDEQLDTGPIVVQEPIELPVGMSGPEAEQVCGNMGGRLFVAVLDDIVAGKLQTRPQPAIEGSYAPNPLPADFRIEPAWSAERAFTFMRGTAEWDLPYPIMVGDTALWLTHALRYDSTTRLDAPYQIEDDALAIQFNPGVLWARARSRRSAGKATS